MSMHWSKYLHLQHSTPDIASSLSKRLRYLFKVFLHTRKWISGSLFDTKRFLSYTEPHNATSSLIQEIPELYRTTYCMRCAWKQNDWIMGGGAYPTPPSYLFYFLFFLLRTMGHPYETETSTAHRTLWQNEHSVTSLHISTMHPFRHFHGASWGSSNELISAGSRVTLPNV